MAKSIKKPVKKPVHSADLGNKSRRNSDPNSIRHDGVGRAEKVFSATSTFFSGLLAISASQFIGAPLKLLDSESYKAYMAWTKESFAILVTTITQWWAPTVIRVSGNEAMKGQLFLMDDGTLKCNFPHRLILMANHQLYTDWLYLWWIAYTNKMHGRIYIILKESLKRVPIMGWGMQLFNFIFLSRKWERDRLNFKRHLDHLKNPKDPMWLLIFPEGTNLSAATREKSLKWAEKTGLPDMKHQLLPHSLGLQFCLQELRGSTNWLYDCTIAYEGVPLGMYGQDIFTLKSSLFEGRPPKSVNMYWRRFNISEIPYEDDRKFSRWLTNRWREKDYILEYFSKFGNFPAEQPTKAMLATEGKRKPAHAKSISTYIKSAGWNEFLSIFGPLTTVASALSGVGAAETHSLNEMIHKALWYQQHDSSQLDKASGMSASQYATGKVLPAANEQNAPSETLLKKQLETVQQKQAQAKHVSRRVDDLSGKAPLLHQPVQEETQKDQPSTVKHSRKVIPSIHHGGKASSLTAASEAASTSMQRIVPQLGNTQTKHAGGQSEKTMAARRAQNKRPVLPC